MFRKLARRDRLPDVLDGLAAAATAGLAPVKVNAVLMRGLNEDEAVPLLRLLPGHGYELRFIEQMPLDAQHGWKRGEMVTADEILAALSRGVHADPRRAGGSVARRRPRRSWSTAARPRVGVIASVTRPFCGSCDRVRLTADGQVRNCLFARTETDLRGPLRGRRQRRRARRAMAGADGGQAAGPRDQRPVFLQPDRPMSAIGG